MKNVYFQDTNAPVVVQNIFCIGRNYAAHIAELNNRREEQPLIFLKPTSALHQENSPIVLPQVSKEIHYETELVLLIEKGGKNIAQAEALKHIGGYGIGLDLTARDLQASAKTHGLPWTVAKGFDGSACISRFLPTTAIPNPEQCRFEMKLNGKTRQKGDTGLMLFSVSYVIAYLSQIFTLSPGDLIFTGTPEGVGPLQAGDKIDLNLADKLHAAFTVAPFSS